MTVNSASGFRPDQENVAYIGAGVTLKGEISVPDLIVIDGTVEGDITARVVCVGQSGVVRGNISATEADISGWVTDHIEIKQLLIVRATGRVEGRVMYGEIELEKGAVVTGDLSATDDYRAVAKSAPSKPLVSDRSVEAPAPVTKSAGSSLDRISEAVRFAKGGGTRSSSLYLAAEGGGLKRGNGRSPLAGRKANA